MSEKLLVASALIACVMLSGCGSKGPLYIPEQRYPQKAQPEAPADKPPSEQVKSAQ